MQRLEFSGVVRLIYGSLGDKRLMSNTSYVLSSCYRIRFVEFDGSFSAALLTKKKQAPSKQTGQVTKFQQYTGNSHLTYSTLGCCPFPSC